LLKNLSGGPRSVCGKKVLVVDDSSTVRTAVQFILGDQGLELIMAEDGRQAVERALQDRPDLILMDVEMPHLNGFEACRQLRQQEPTRDTPIILITSRGAPVDVARGYESGCTLYLTKPFEAERLRAVVKRLLARGGPGRREPSHGAL
jgi:CheY-like chemotaxis protein